MTSSSHASMATRQAGHLWELLSEKVPSAATRSICCCEHNDEQVGSHLQQGSPTSLDSEDGRQFLTNLSGKRMCHGMLNFMKVLPGNNIISRCIALK